MLLCVILLASCDIKLGRNDRNKRNLPTTSMQDFLYTYTKTTGFREWEVKAAQALTYENNDVIYLYNLTMTLFSESNQIKTVLVANKGSVQQNIGNLMAEGEVRVFSSNHSELQTEKIYWDQQKELFYSETNKLVEYFREKNKVTGYNLISDSLLENVELDNSVGQIKLGDNLIINASTNKSSDAEFLILE